MRNAEQEADLAVFAAASRPVECAKALDTGIAAYLIKREFSLEVDEQPAVAEEVVEAGFSFHEGMHGRVQQLHQLPQSQQLTVHCPNKHTHTHTQPVRRGPADDYP